MAVSSSIRIEDGFSEPLKELAVESWKAESAATALGKGLMEQRKYFNELQGDANELTGALRKNLIPGIQSLGRDAAAAKDSFMNMIRTRDIESVKEFGNSFSELSENVKQSSKSAADWVVSYVKITTLLKHRKLLGTGGMALFASKALIETYKSSFRALQGSIEKSLDDIDITDRLTSMFGEAGAVAKDRAYALANEIGESASMVSELAARSAYEGIGTEHFERMMKLADKVGKLRAGESTEGAANTLMSNLKSGHDASTVAQMLGGGELMERQLRRSGYERALNRGDLDKALSIAEKIAEQAGLTDEAYANATGTMSQNYKNIMNTVTNIKHRLAEIYNQSFAPTVAKLNKLVTSDSFKRLVSYAEIFVSLIGKAANWVMEGLVDNFKIVGVLFGVGVVSKTLFILKLASKLLKILGIVGGPLGFIIKKMLVIGKMLVLHLAKMKAMALLKIAGPFLGVGAAIAGATYGIYKLSGATEDFTDWIKDKLHTASRIMAAGYRILQNVFANIFIFFDRVGDYIMNLPSLAKAAFQDILDELEELRAKIRGEELRPKIYIDKKEFEAMSEDVKKELGVMTEMVTSSGPVRGFSSRPGGGGHAAEIKYFYYGEPEVKKSRTEELIEKIQETQLQYIDVWEGSDKALEEGWGTTVDWLKKIFEINEEQNAKAGLIQTDTNKIRKFNEQEEELRWLKAFSDRQIMSSYSSMTSNSKTVNINGMSQSSLAEMGRRNISTIPSRAAM